MRIVCIGELLIDFVCSEQDVDLATGTSFVKEAGGAPANVASCVSRLGGQAYFVGAVGSDPFGSFLSHILRDYGVNTDYLFEQRIPTSMAFVSLFDNGERDFVFNRGADEHLALSQKVISELIDDSILHFGSATALLGGELYRSYTSLARMAKANGNFICFDPNYRIDLWRNREREFVEKCTEFLRLADIVKVSEEELVLLTGIDNQEEACNTIHELGVQYVLVTLGSKGCRVSSNSKQYVVPARKISAVDTTGAGDAFIGAILYKLAKTSASQNPSYNELSDFVKFAVKVSAKVCSKIGAMSSLPSLEEVNHGVF